MTNSTESLSSPRAPMFQRIAEFRENFAQESDRACVVLVAAKLDELLHQLLTSFLLPPPTQNDNFLDSDGALGTFSSKIDACYRLGLIDADFCRSLHLLRKIRNEFAHVAAQTSLEVSPHRERVMNLASFYKGYREFFDVEEKEFPECQHARKAFSACAFILVVRLERALFDSRRIASVAVTLIPETFEKQPNKPVEVTPTAVTPAADAPSAPSAGAPHH